MEDEVGGEMGGGGNDIGMRRMGMDFIVFVSASNQTTKSRDDVIKQDSANPSALIAVKQPLKSRNMSDFISPSQQKSQQKSRLTLFFFECLRLASFC
jgi:hypothetical protein